jgi:geranylgeranyl diphosphate synthase type I
MSLSRAIERYLPQIEAELRAALATPHPALAGFYGMMQYHMGWTDQSFQPVQAPTGKRLRPLFCVLACQAAGGDPAHAMPAAAAIEILHNFSLLHDDIEDNSPLRRHRPAVWTIWGIPQTINVGDGMFAAAFLTMGRLAAAGVPARLCSLAASAFQETCLTLTEGQYLDMSFETRPEVELDEYLWMIQAKTAALLGTATRIGALLADAGSDIVAAYREFGTAVGMAFQIQDDILGIWGNETFTGKPGAGDIAQRKKTLPLVYTMAQLKQRGQPAALARLLALYEAAATDAGAIHDVLEILDDAGARRYCEEQVAEYQELALSHLARAAGAPGTDVEGLQALRELALSLVGRQA